MRKGVYLMGVSWKDNYWKGNLNNYLIDRET